MSESESEPDGEPPRSSLPDPHIQDGDGSPTYRDSSTGPREDAGSDDAFRRHPLDPYEPVPKRSGCGRACGCALGVIAGIALLLAALVFAAGWLGPGRFVSEGYEVVRFEEPFVTVRQPPDRPTCYIGRKIRFHFSTCEVAIAAIGTEVEVAGNFLERISFTAPKVTLTGAARFEKEVEIYAFEFRDRGAIFLENRTGRIYEDFSP